MVQTHTWDVDVGGAATPVGTGVTCTQDCTGMITPCVNVTTFAIGQSMYVFLSWSTGHDYYGERVGYRWTHNGSIYSEYLWPAYITHPDGLVYCMGPTSDLTVGSGSIEILWAASGQTTAQVIGTSNSYTVGGATTYLLTRTYTGTGSVYTTSPTCCNFSPGTIVTLYPQPAIGWHFDHWTGDLTGTANPGSITMNSDKSIGAVYLQGAGGDICQWITDQGGWNSLTVTDIIYLITCHVTPTGCPLTPTINDLIGAIYYHVGNKTQGNNYTGCVF